MARPGGRRRRAGAGHQRRGARRRPGARCVDRGAGRGRHAGRDAGAACVGERQRSRGDSPPAFGRHRGLCLRRRPAPSLAGRSGRRPRARPLPAFGAVALVQEPAPLVSAWRWRAHGGRRRGAGHAAAVGVGACAAAAPNGRLAPARRARSRFARAAPARRHRPRRAGRAAAVVADGAVHERGHLRPGDAGAGSGARRGVRAGSAARTGRRAAAAAAGPARGRPAPAELPGRHRPRGHLESDHSPGPGLGGPVLGPHARLAGRHRRAACARSRASAAHRRGR